MHVSVYCLNDHQPAVRKKTRSFGARSNKWLFPTEPRYRAAARTLREGVNISCRGF